MLNETYLKLKFDVNSTKCLVMELRCQPSLPGPLQTMYMSLPALGGCHDTSSLKCDLAHVTP